MKLVEVTNKEQISNTHIRDQFAASKPMIYSRRFLATESGAEVGFLHTEFWPVVEERFVIYEIFVPTSLRRRGIGTWLLAAAEEVARDLGHKSVLLIPKAMDETFDQQRLKEWYASKGYVLLEDGGNGAFVKQLG
jgi:GNAT superfamily N-acetyltransferase